MLLNQIMSRNVKSLPPTATAADAARLMATWGIGMVPVVERDHPMGVVTDRDIVTRVVAKGENPAETPLQDVMTFPAACCQENCDLEEAARTMEKHHIRRLPILDSGHRLVGIVSLEDVAVYAHTDRLTGEILATVAEPTGATLPALR